MESEGPLKRIGEALRLLRDTQRPRMSQVDLATAAGVAPPNLSDYENGKVMPNVATLNRILAALGQTDLYGLADALAEVSGETPTLKGLHRQVDELREVVGRLLR